LLPLFETGLIFSCRMAAAEAPRYRATVDPEPG